MTVTNVAADAVVTAEWLSIEGTILVIPVYQRQYRWEIEGCQRLLRDLRAVARTDAGETHFFGSILYTATSSDDGTERMLIDGQQRVTTLMLLLAAIRDTLAGTDVAISEVTNRILQHPTHASQTRLRLRSEGARELANIVFSRPTHVERVAISHLQNNYQFFLKEIRNHVLEVWNGLQKLVHVAIELREHVNPQQVFESLNSTGTPLRNHELIHNYVLMGLTERQQLEIEDSYWIPIEENTGDAIDTFLRNYLILRTGRDNDFKGVRGEYEVFKKEFPAPKYSSLKQAAAKWKAYSEVYRFLLNPSRINDEEIARQLAYCNTFGAAMHPLLLKIYHDYELNVIDRNTLLEILEQLQSLYLRKTLVGASRDHLAAQLCRKLQQYGYPIRDIARQMPTDERIRVALKHKSLPHAGYVLRRLEEPFDLDQVGELQIEHIFPQFAGTTWSGDGSTEWGDFSETDRASYREVLPTIGNLTLLEPALNAAAGNKPFSAKTAFYEASKVPSTRQLASNPTWDLKAIADRTLAMTERFLEIWQRPITDRIDDGDYLVPILDVSRKPGYYTGWKTEFEYVQFCGEIWEIRDVKSLYYRTFERLWETNQQQVLNYSAHISRESPISKTREGNNRHWTKLGDHYLFMGFFPQYMLAEVQGVLDSLDMADNVLVKYSTNDD